MNKSINRYEGNTPILKMWSINMHTDFVNGIVIFICKRDFDQEKEKISRRAYISINLFC